MLNIYYGSEQIDKEKFIFEQIKGKTLLLVPDQFSLQAERDAFFYLQEKGLIDLRVVDFSALGHKVLNQVGGRKPPLIDKYGRHMLLTRIISRLESELKVYRGMSQKNSFIDLMNGMISEMKRFEILPEHLQAAVEQLEDSSFLKYKLEDIETIYTAYQQEIQGKYLDSEDYITFYGEKMMQAELIRESEIWIYGFDTFTPKNLLIIERLLKAARNVNIVLTYDDSGEEDAVQGAAMLAADSCHVLYDLSRQVMKILQELAEQLNETVSIKKISADALRCSVWNGGTCSGIYVAETSGMYAEAERAAADILRLVRDEGYRFGEIAVVCNEELRSGILKRTFQRWGIPVFMDKKRTVMHHPAVGYLLALLEILVRGYREDVIFQMLKSGIAGLDLTEVELLENYVRQYRIRGKMWKEPFSKGEQDYDAEALNKLNHLRELVVREVEGTRTAVGARNTVREKIMGLYRFLTEDSGLMERLQEMILSQETAGLTESAAETAQSWSVICNILDQLVETLGGERISNEQLLKLMKAGFEEVEIGLVPVSSDCVTIGTLQRTRASRIRALFIAGANEGILPLERSDEGLLSEREKDVLEAMDLQLSKREDVARQEERLALYRILSLPQEKLYVSCSAVNAEGEMLRPSRFLSLLREWLSPEAVRSDLDADLQQIDSLPECIASKRGTMPYLADMMRGYLNGASLPEVWEQVLLWYQEHAPEELAHIMRGIDFTNQTNLLGAQFADALYRSDLQKLELSASRLEQYSSCPFSHFVNYGLRPDELRIYEVGAREIGDVYHECLMRFSRKLMRGLAPGVSIRDEDSPWMQITVDGCREAVRQILSEDMSEYRQGLLAAGTVEQYRSERIADICSDIAWSMVSQVRHGVLKDMQFEVPFGAGKRLPPVTVDLGDREVMIRGKIDRLDVLEAVSQQASESDPEFTDVVRIVDYKTGTDAIDLDYFRSGYKLQLMVYLQAAMQDRAKPAGVFYFKIHNLDTDADAKKVEPGDADARQRLEEAYKLEGIVLNEPELIAAMDDHFEKNSAVIPVKRSKKEGYAASAGGALLSQEEFQELYEQVDRQVKRICREICDGEIAVAPKKEKRRDLSGNYRTSCNFCRYQSICWFDTSFEGCRYRKA